ncbi:MAG: hypothetical protein VX201_03790, partial [Pseudomonadota bacterium]|nr:hypothetical protein [Pseudomonadota bacterium]
MTLKEITIPAAMFLVSSKICQTGAGTLMDPEPRPKRKWQERVCTPVPATSDVKLPQQGKLVTSNSSLRP